MPAPPAANAAAAETRWQRGGSSFRGTRQIAGIARRQALHAAALPRDRRRPERDGRQDHERELERPEGRDDEGVDPDAGHAEGRAHVARMLGPVPARHPARS